MSATGGLLGLVAPRFTITDRQPGYAHVRIQGTCAADATVEEVRKAFYHDYFGGRDAWVSDGRFGVVVHTD